MMSIQQERAFLKSRLIEIVTKLMKYYMENQLIEVNDKVDFIHTLKERGLEKQSYSYLIQVHNLLMKEINRIHNKFINKVLDYE